MRALARNPDRARHLARQGATLVRGDLDDADALQQLVSGCAAVIHAAGAVRGATRARFDHINVTGTANVLAAVAAQASPPRMLLVSSLAAREPDLSWYAGSKRAAEALLERRPDLDWLILRPPVVYGPGDREMLPVFKAMTWGIAPVPGDATARISLVQVTDLVTAIIACLQSSATRHQTLTLCDGKTGGYDWREMADLVGTVWGRKVRLWQVPSWLLDGVAWVNVQAARLIGAAPMLTPPKLRELRHHNWVVNNEDIARTAGWQPETGLRQGLEELRHAEL